MAQRSPFLRRTVEVSAQQPRTARALTAAGQRIDPTNQAQVKRVTGEPRDWQMRAMAFYDELGEVRYGARWMGDAISRLRIIPAYQDNPTEPPVPLEMAERPESELAAANGALARLATGAESGLSGLMRSLAINVWLVGETYLVGYSDDVGEQWEVASVEAIVQAPQGGLALRTSPTMQLQEALIPLPEDDSVVIQIMRRHPRWRDWPDAAMRGALEYCEDLSLLTRMIRATASSRVPAGLLFIPDEASFGPGNLGDADGDIDRDPLTEDLLRHMTEPIRTPGDAAAVVPFVLRMSRADIAAVRMEMLDRPIDQLAVGLREEARRSLAAVLDLPAEILAGKGGLNHWTAWQVDQEAFQVHVEPLAVLILDALSTEYYQAALDAAGVEDPGHHRLWYDASALVASPDAADTAFRLYDRGEITGSSLRAAVGVSDGEAPDEEELARRATLRDIIAPRQGASEPGQGTPGPPTPRGPAGAGIEADPLAPGALALQAAGPPADLILPDAEPIDVAAADALRLLGRALLTLDREVRLRVQQAADEAARRALEKAGNRLRSLANRDRTGLARSLAAVPAPEVGATLGQALIASLGTSAVELADGALEPLRPRFARWIEQAFESVVLMLEPWAGGYDYARFRQALPANIDAAFTYLSTEVEAIVAQRIINPTPEPPQAGEWDDTVIVPPAVIRRTLLLAGGGAGETRITAAIPGPVAAELVGGLITSEMLYDMLAESAGLILAGDGWRWAYGTTLSRVSPFQPHVALDGTEFTDWQGASLRNTGGWPDAYFYPGDHLWCQCDVEPLITPAPEPKQPAGDAEYDPGRMPSPEPAPEPEVIPEPAPEPEPVFAPEPEPVVPEPAAPLPEPVAPAPQPVTPAPTTAIQPGTGDSVLRTFEDLRTPGQKVFTKTLEDIGRVHRMPKRVAGAYADKAQLTPLERVALKTATGNGPKGGHYRRGPGILEIKVVRRKPPKVDDSHFSLLHELGHYLDNIGKDVKSRGDWYSANPSNLQGAMGDLLRGIKDSEAYKTLSDPAIRRRIGEPYFQYASSPEELWARAYSQWAANQIGGPALEGLRASQASEAWYGYQWSDEDFEPIGRLVEAVLRERGLIK